MGVTTPLSPVACWLITRYQRHVSPYKGFRCAYRALRGRDSCSQFAAKAIRRYGLAAGLRLTRRRFDHCRWASYVLDYDGRRRQDLRDRPLWCVNGWDPSCGDVDAMCCAGDVAAQGCIEVAGACH